MTHVVVIGGGPAGLAAAVEASREGADVTVLEAKREIGGIPMQCIHTGFGLFEFGEELSGPEYSQRYINMARNNDKIKILTGVFVREVKPDRVRALTSEGWMELDADAVVYTVGARERTRYEVGIGGTRPTGVYNAGMAQEMMNLYGLKPGRKAVVIGSGDIGLIMARRMTLEGIEVVGVYEILPYPSGLARNIRQCLEDFDIPLHLSESVVEIKGLNRVEGVVTAKYDDKLNVIPGTEQFVECDTVVLSVGLIPDIGLIEEAGAEKDRITGGAVVDSRYMTTTSGIFAAGNAVHIHDVVDNVSYEGRIAGKWAARYAKGERWSANITTEVEGLRYTVPQRLVEGDKVRFWGRVPRPLGRCKIVVESGGKKEEKIYLKAVPSEMVSIDADVTGSTVVKLEGGDHGE